MKLYPELIWNKGNFIQSGGVWKERNFFEEFAIRSNFNPLDAERWGSVTRMEIEKAVSCEV